MRKSSRKGKKFSSRKEKQTSKSTLYISTDKKKIFCQNLHNIGYDAWHNTRHVSKHVVQVLFVIKSTNHTIITNSHLTKGILVTLVDNVITKMTKFLSF